MKRAFATIIDYAAANIAYTALVCLWLVVVVGTAENVLTGSDSWRTFAWVVIAPAIFFALVTLKSPDVRRALWSRINPPKQDFGRLTINKSRPKN